MCATAVLAVVKPIATSIGGDVFALVYDARSRRVTAYNGSGASPASLDLERLARGFPETGALLATVPRAIAAIGSLLAESLLASSARLSWSRVPVSF